MNASLPFHEIDPRDPAWRELSPGERFRALQRAVDDNKTARQRVIASLKGLSAPGAKSPHRPTPPKG